MSDIFVVDANTYDDVESQLQKHREAIRNATVNPPNDTNISVVTFRWDQPKKIMDRFYLLYFYFRFFFPSHFNLSCVVVVTNLKSSTLTFHLCTCLSK